MKYRQSSNERLLKSQISLGRLTFQEKIENGKFGLFGRLYRFQFLSKNVNTLKKITLQLLLLIKLFHIVLMEEINVSILTDR